MASRELITRHLFECEFSFSPRLSSYIDIDSYASKLFERSSRVEAFADGVLVGLICYYIRTDSSVFVSNFSIASNFQGSGLATELFNRFKTLISKEVCNIELEVHRTNLRAMKFYLKSGFGEVGGDKEKAVLVYPNI